MAMIAIVLEGGLVSAVVSDDPKLQGAEVMVIDYDTEGADVSEIVMVPQRFGEDVEAVARFDTVEDAAIDMQKTAMRLKAKR